MLGMQYLGHEHDEDRTGLSNYDMTEWGNPHPARSHWLPQRQPRRLPPHRGGRSNPSRASSSTASTVATGATVAPTRLGRRHPQGCGVPEVSAIKVRVTMAVEIDPKAWGIEYGMEGASAMNPAPTSSATSKTRRPSSSSRSRSSRESLDDAAAGHPATRSTYGSRPCTGLPAHRKQMPEPTGIVGRTVLDGRRDPGRG